MKQLALVSLLLASLEGRTEACANDREPDIPPLANPGEECMEDVAAGYALIHTREYYEVRLAAADVALRMSSGRLDALDTKSVSLLRLGRLAEAKTALVRRAAVSEDVRVLANLGTYFTMIGDLRRATAYVDRVLAIDPDAHRGGERYHAALLAYSQELARDPKKALSRDMLGNAVDRVGPATPNDLEILAGLRAMLETGGAHHSSHVYFAFGNVLARAGMPRAAWAAWQRAKDLKHPNPDVIGALQQRLETAVRVDSARWYAARRAEMGKSLAAYEDAERDQIRRGLAVWTDAGVVALRAIWDELNPTVCRAKAVR
jgi:tetratricopeptide (TPR) repeat protein